MTDVTDVTNGNMRLIRVRRRKKAAPVAAPVVAPALPDNVVVLHPEPARKGPLRKKNKDYRTREYLLDNEIDILTNAVKDTRNPHRNATIILVAMRHGFRVSELTDLRWSQIDFGSALIHVRRIKNGTPSTQPILGDELRALRRLEREQKETLGGRRHEFVFLSENKTPMTNSAVAKMLERASGGLDFKAHPHMLRHACGFALANKGHDTRSLQGYLGHKNIQHTVVYTDLAPDRFKDFWR